MLRVGRCNKHMQKQPNTLKTMSRYGRLITAVSSLTKVLMVAGVDVTDGVTVVMSTGKI